MIKTSMIVAMLLMVTGVGVSAQAPGPALAASTDCMSELLTMSDCLTYVEEGSNLTKPDKPCCPELAALVNNSPICLCYLLQKNSTSSYGIEIDLNRALHLPSVCKVETPPTSTCALLGIPVGAPTPSEGPAANSPAVLDNDGTARINAKPAKSNVKKVRIIVSSTVLSTVLLILGLALLFYVWKKDAGKLSRSQKEEDLELPLFDLAAVVCATCNFSNDNKLGEGGFGSVFKGILKDGQEIAVKRLSKDSGQGLSEFKNEVVHISKLQHRNLVKLLGCCIQEDEMVLIYECMPNKSLDFFIFDRSKSMLLDWPKRFDIINGIARGLLYLHQDSRLRVIHRDLKAGNILLDREFNPKISDFGIARSFAENESTAKTKKVIGTYGYMSPEYTMDGCYSMKSDVYSFGVLVLEIVSGKRNRGFSHPGHNLNLLGHAWKLYTEGRCIELLEPSVEDSSTPHEVLRSIHVGLLCVQQNPEDRPSMPAAVLMLSGEGALPQPQKPGFYSERNLTELEVSTNEATACSASELTVTLLHAR